MKTYIVQHSAPLLGIALIVAGFSLRMLIGKRRFDRRRIKGLQQFSSYTKWLITTRIESFLVLAAWVFILSGLVLTGNAWYANH